MVRAEQEQRGGELRQLRLSHTSCWAAGWRCPHCACVAWGETSLPTASVSIYQSLSTFSIDH